jgi:hypothetical protein
VATEKFVNCCQISSTVYHTKLDKISKFFLKFLWVFECESANFTVTIVNKIFGRCYTEKIRVCLNGHLSDLVRIRKAAPPIDLQKTKEKKSMANPANSQKI